MALISKDKLDWVEVPSIYDEIIYKAEKELSNLLNEEIIKHLYQNGVLSKSSIELLKNKDNHIGRFFFMDYPALETKKSD